MRLLRRSASLLLLAGLVTLVLIGCGQAPTAPQTAQFTATPGSAAQPEGLLSGLGSVVDALVGLIVRTLNLVGSLGGALTNGRWRVTIPAGAVDGNATVQLGIENLTSPTCQLEISPADKNHFSVPATLTVDCRGVPTDQLRNYVIFWRDPATGQWVPVQGSKVDLVARTVSAPLQHFSKYAVGNGTQAGW